MNIKYREKKFLKFGSITTGETFIYRDCDNNPTAYMKICGAVYNTVNLDLGILVNFEDNDCVESVDFTLVES